MCGIFGFYSTKQAKWSTYQKLFNQLGSISTSRGREASGLAVATDNNSVYISRSELSAKEFFQSQDYKSYKKMLASKLVTTAIGHSRLATHGSQLKEDNNQPVVSNHNQLVGVHNGIVTNTNELFKIYATKKTEKPELDSQVLFDYLEKTIFNQEFDNFFKSIFSSVEGSFSIAALIPNRQALLLATNTGSLYWTINDDQQFIFASEKVFLMKTLGQDKKIYHLKPRTSLLVKKKEGSIDIKTDISLIKQKKLTNKNHPQTKIFRISTTKKSKAHHLYTTKNSLKKLKEHTFDLDRIKAIKRCNRCILPSTTPFITFDENGVCNFCHEHQPIKYKGVESLKKLVNKYRKDDGPDCLVAFSGGRDSSYGLHFLKNELKLNPLAYTYDWGMVTNLARENQARILGKLGVEHIIISADITKKREHIRQNILAWIENPHLGMVPLFMEGDKQCEFYADQLMQQYDLDLMFFFRGNEFEKEEFKTGHCGIKNADPGGVIHNLALMKKIKLLTFYASQYIKNPKYFNSSFFDTSLAFFSTYIQKHNFVFLWHYVPWNEKIILKTLQEKYNWQKHPETVATWRTDDGTSAFYNYIYYQVQGFTENDSFRARQVREGRITRKKALKLVHLENQPRYEALNWYFNQVGLDGNRILSLVDQIPKLY